MRQWTNTTVHSTLEWNTRMNVTKHKTQYILTLILTISFVVCSILRYRLIYTLFINIIQLFQVLFIIFILKHTWLLFRDSSPSSKLQGTPESREFCPKQIRCRVTKECQTIQVALEFFHFKVTLMGLSSTIQFHRFVDVNHVNRFPLYINTP